MAVVEKIAENGTARRDDDCEAAAGSWRDFLEFGTVQISEELGALRPSCAPIRLVRDRIDVAVGNENIKEAVIVEVEEAGAPAEEWNRGIPETGFEGNVGERGIAIVTIESFVIVGEGSDEEIELAVAIVVAGADAHGRLAAAITIDSESRHITDVGE